MAEAAASCCQDIPRCAAVHLDSGGVSACLLLGFGFGEAKAKGFVSPLAMER